MKVLSALRMQQQSAAGRIAYCTVRGAMCSVQLLYSHSHTHHANSPQRAASPQSILILKAPSPHAPPGPTCAAPPALAFTDFQLHLRPFIGM